MPVISRLLAAASPTAIKTIRAGLMVANSPYCSTLTGESDSAAPFSPVSQTAPLHSHR